MASLHLPSFEEIKDYVVSSNEFRERLAEAARETKRLDKETSLELQLDLDGGTQSLSQVYLGTEDLAAAVPRPEGYIALLHLHSHPNQRVIRPSGGDLLFSISTNSKNFQRLMEKDEGVATYPDIGRTINLAKSYSWSTTEAIITVYDNLTIGMLLYRMINSLDKSFKEFPKRPSQRDIVNVMRENGHSAVNFLKYKSDKDGKYTLA